MITRVNCPVVRNPGCRPYGPNPKPQTPNSKLPLRGFTLIELLLVIVIIGILATLVVPRFVGRSKEAQIAAAKQQIADFETALDMYELDNGSYPTTAQGLQALVEKPSGSPEPKNWKGPYLKKALPNDPWGNPYKYVCPGVHNTKGCDIESFGPDGQDGGGDDVENWK